MSTPIPDSSTMNGALHMLIAVVSGQIAQLSPEHAAALHAQVDVRFPLPAPPA